VAFTTITVAPKPQRFGNVLTFEDLTNALVKANFPADVTVPLEAFKSLIMMVKDEQVFRSTDAVSHVYIDIWRCRVHPEIDTEGMLRDR